MGTSRSCFIEVDHAQERKASQAACGDVFLSQKLEEGDRVVSVLADGLGSGIKASVLAQLTATMAARYAAENADITRAAATILETLPVCSERQIAYSTFTIVDVEARGETRVVEYDNPPFLLIRGGEVVAVPKEERRLPTADGREALLREARFTAQPGDRIVICSDGVTQARAGISGSGPSRLGWGQQALSAYLKELLQGSPGLSARQLARQVVVKALALDGQRAKDDITCGVIYLRVPREVLVLTGAPVDTARDAMLAQRARAFQGRKIICGGTTARILSRELGLSLLSRPGQLGGTLPPESQMQGFDLVTEGALTLAAVIRLLEAQEVPERFQPSPATRLAEALVDSDVIHVLAGTRINEAMQDPTLPLELDIRRNLLQRLQRVLQETYLKEVRVSFL
ncbi:PP2C family protein-serine/threonine phosphatase [Geothrix sp. PMB-07]|uniref:PP2C family protein-serine/threonine phosphatase n=1 Tax=Geothrix sp. PMB-07 TaxID=3068640 RepID=UPI00274189A8|nr:PP2C family protein-serine/threonine phosphatase [Geothrix sp. PMB-07]WLT31032.1 PP2C family protein-serine/threonine phosphatase [Geothrix sp. PMB-07]